MTSPRVSVAIAALATISVAGATVWSDRDAAASDSNDPAVTSGSIERGPLLADGDSVDLALDDATADTAATDIVSTLPVRSGTESTAIDLGPRPVGLRLPELGVSAEIDDVGVDDEQRLEVPAVDRIGWYRFGARPGEPGATVLAGHVDFGGEAGVFWELRESRIGDEVDVELEDGSVRTYVVTDVTLYDKTELPNDDLFRRSGDEAIHLITCGGTFDRIQRSYRGNVVVTAVPAS